MNNKIIMTLLITCLLASLIGTITSLQTISAEASTPTYKIAAPEQPSPFDRIPEEHIKVYHNRVVIYLNNPEWAYFYDTNSMDPVIDKEAHAIQIVPKKEEEIHVGDIISYQSKLNNNIIIHRVIDIKEDNNGWYAITKGDNNKLPDPEKVRFEQITRVVIAVIY